jgi:hypothetical protein
MREREWYRHLAELHALIVPLYQARGLPIPDFQDLQHQLCEYGKYAQIKRGLKQRLKREYRPPLEPKAARTRKPRPSVEPPSTAPSNGVVAAVEAADGVQFTASSLAPRTPPDDTKELLDLIAQEQAAEQERAKTKPTPYQIDFASASLPPALIPLTTLPRWVNWRWEYRDGKWTKPPIQPGNGRFARNNDPIT